MAAERGPAAFAPQFLPSLSAVPFAVPSGGRAIPLLSKTARSRLAAIGEPLYLRAGSALYREGMPVESLYVIVQGVVKTQTLLPSGKRRVTAFLFAEDLCGLGEEGCYVGTAIAVTAVSLYRLPFGKLDGLLHHDAELDYDLLCKLCHELRRAQRHTIVVGRGDACGKLAMFLSVLSERQPGEAGATIAIPMSRSDIADFVGLSLEAVSRGFSQLQRDGIIAMSGPRSIRITDRHGFAGLLAAG
jgi:CRP-like cAMP-binding protein